VTKKKRRLMAVKTKNSKNWLEGENTEKKGAKQKKSRMRLPERKQKREHRGKVVLKPRPLTTRGDPKRGQTKETNPQKGKGRGGDTHFQIAMGKKTAVCDISKNRECIKRVAKPKRRERHKGPHCFRRVSGRFKKPGTEENGGWEEARKAPSKAQAKGDRVGLRGGPFFIKPSQKPEKKQNSSEGDHLRNEGPTLEGKLAPGEKGSAQQNSLLDG